MGRAIALPHLGACMACYRIPVVLIKLLH